jgi:NDP-sugar pyrophosphorylase family protein
MGLFKTPAPSACGIALVNNEGLITDFEEKPENPKSNSASAGIFISSPGVLDIIPEKETADVGFDLIPHLVNRMNGWQVKDYLIDIGTHENLQKAEADWCSFYNNKQESKNEL